MENNWPTTFTEWKRIKLKYGWANETVAAMFAGKYKSGRAFEASTAYKKMVTGIVSIVNEVEKSKI